MASTLGAQISVLAYLTAAISCHRRRLRLLKEQDEVRLRWREQIERGWQEAQEGIRAPAIEAFERGGRLDQRVRRWHRRRQRRIPWCSPGMPAQAHQLLVDHSERHSALLEAARRSGLFDVRMVDLDTGDYLIDDAVLVERKTIGDFIASLVDGRLFPQTARLAHSRYRSLLMIEGPRPPST